MILRRSLARQTNRIVIAALLDVGGGAPVAGDGAATIGAITASGAGSVAVNGTGTATIGAIEASGSGVLGAAVTGSGTATIGSITAASAGSAGVNGASTATLGALATVAAGSAAIVGAGAATIGAISATSKAYMLVGACTAGVLTVDPTNGRYFRNNAGPLVLAGFHTWASIQDSWPSLPITPLDFDEYLDALVSYGCNFTKAWFLESAKDWGDSVQYFAPHPWPRTGPGNAADGLPKFDLSQHNQAYFDRLRERVIRLGNAGIYVCVQLFQGWHVAQKGYTTGDPWANHPMAAANNINAIDGDTNDDGIGYETRSTSFTAVYDLQKAYVEKVLTALNDLDNVFYEIANEEDSSSLTWQRALVDHIQTYEAGLPKQHAVGMTVCWPAGDNQDLYDTTTIDWLSGNGDLTPDAASDAKINAYDTDHINGLTAEYTWIFRALCQGYNPWYMDEWAGETYGTDRRSDATYQKIRSILGYAVERAGQIDLANATPQPSLASTGYCLAKTTGTVQLLAYQDNSGAFTVNLTGIGGTFSLQWLRTANGTVQAGSNVAGGAVRTLTPPWSGEDVVALLELAGYSGTAAATIGGLTASGAASASVNGAAAATIGAMVAVAVGVVDVTGADQAVVGALVAAAAGSVAVNGAGAAVVGAVEAASAGSVAVAGDAAATIGALEAAGAGTTSSGSVSGGAATVIGDIAAAGVGSASVNGAAAALVGAIVAASVVAVAVNGAGAADLGTFEASGFGGSGAGGAALATIGDIVAAGAGSASVNGAALATIGDVMAAGAGAVPVSGVGLATVGALVAAGASSVAVTADGSAVIGAIVASGSGALTDLPEIHGAAAVTIGAITASGAGVVAWVLALGRLAGPGVPGVVSGPKSSIGE